MKLMGYEKVNFLPLMHMLRGIKTVLIIQVGLQGTLVIGRPHQWRGLNHRFIDIEKLQEGSENMKRYRVH